MTLIELVEERALRDGITARIWRTPDGRHRVLLYTPDDRLIDSRWVNDLADVEFALKALAIPAQEVSNG